MTCVEFSPCNISAIFSYYVFVSLCSSKSAILFY